MPSHPRRLRSFSLRTLMVLMTLACFGLAVVSNAAFARISALRRWARQAGVEVRTVRASNEFLHSIGNFDRMAPETVPWFRQLLGDEDIKHIRFYTWGNPSNEEIESAKHLFPEATVEQWWDGNTSPSAPYGFPQPPTP